MIKLIADKLAFSHRLEPCCLKRAEVFQLKAWHESPAALEPIAKRLMGGGAAHTWASNIVNMLDVKDRSDKPSEAKGPEQFAAWVAENRDAIEGAWMMGMAVFVSVPASADRQFVEDMIVELQELLTDEYQVRVETEAEPPENEDWERIKKYETKGSNHKFSVVMVPFHGEIDQQKWEFIEQIPQDDIDEKDGIEFETHITALFGLTSDKIEDIAPSMRVDPIHATLGKVGVFANEKQDVVFIHVDSPDLVALHDELSKLPNEEGDREFIPHATLAYLKPGKGSVYDGDDRFEGMEVVFNEIIFSASNGDRTTLTNRGGKSWKAAEKQTPYQKWLDVVGIIPGPKGEPSPFTQKWMDLSQAKFELKTSKEIFPFVYTGVTFKVPASEDIREDEPDTPIIRLARDLAAILERQEAAVTEAIEATKSTKPKKSKKATRRLKITNAQIKRIDDILRSFDAEIREVMRPFAEAMVLEGGNAGIVRLQDIEAVSTAPGVEAGFDVTNPEVSKFLDTYAIELADQVQNQSSAQISQALKAGQEKGESTAQLTKRVQETGRFTPAQAERIARTESARAYIGGQDQSWKQSGVVQGSAWLLAPGACEICQAAAAIFNATQKGIALGQAALKVGDTLKLPSGKTFTIGYQDLTGPPIHPSDRCDKVPILIG